MACKMKDTDTEEERLQAFKKPSEQYTIDICSLPYTEWRQSIVDSILVHATSEEMTNLVLGEHAEGAEQTFSTFHTRAWRKREVACSCAERAQGWHAGFCPNGMAAWTKLLARRVRGGRGRGRCTTQTVE